MNILKDWILHDAISRISQNIFYGKIWVYLLEFCHHIPTYVTFLETLMPWKYSQIFSKIFGNNQDDKDDQEGPKKLYVNWEHIDVSMKFNLTYNIFLASLNNLEIVNHYHDVENS